jgi:hypothetical protein
LLQQNFITQKVKLLDQVRAVARAKHLSHQTEDTYHNFIERFYFVSRQTASEGNGRG